MTTPRRHLLGLEGVSAEDILLLLESAESMKEVSERDVKKVPTLRGKTVINLFLESSTRTRISFEIAAKRLSADSINLSASGSSLSKGRPTVSLSVMARPEPRACSRRSSTARSSMPETVATSTRRRLCSIC
jgi:aspartate carbamoyltransferase catalytic subunit